MLGTSDQVPQKRTFEASWARTSCSPDGFNVAGPAASMDVVNRNRVSVSIRDVSIE